MMRVSATARISISITALMVSLLLLAGLLGLIPDARESLRDARQKVGEALAVQLSVAASRGDSDAVAATLDAFVERNTDVLSAALRRANGAAVHVAGDHAREWIPLTDNASTLTHVLVPIQSGDKPWGALEISFAPPQSGWLGRLKDSGYGLIIFLAITGLATSYLVLRRVLRELDPRGTIPGRVKSAFDALTEGVLVLDERGQIVLANAAFAHRAGRLSADLIGLRAAELKWYDPRANERPATLPWARTLADGATATHAPLRLADAYNGGLRSLLVNATPIMDERQRRRGALVTFSDVTRIEKTNNELALTVERLRESEREIKRKNETLYYLATQDPLTACLNRRAFFEAVEEVWSRVRDGNATASCLMADIDHFKLINDRFGHDVGDKVLQWAADVLRAVTRPADLICRYGGEEFCLILVDAGPVEAGERAHKLRQAIAQDSTVHFGDDLKVTVSIGVASAENGARAISELLNQADRALYASKDGGRDRVTHWSADLGAQGAGTGHARNMPAADRRGAERESLSELREPAGQEPAGRRAAPAATTGDHAPPGQRDPGMGGRIEFVEAIQRALDRENRNGRRTAVLSVVPNQPRRVRDLHGAGAADAMFDEIGRRLRETLRHSDAVARLDPGGGAAVVSLLGGDEFGVLLHDLFGEQDARDILGRMFNALAAPFEHAGHAIDLDVTAGIALTSPADRTPAQLIRNAVAARHDARERSGANRFQFYSTDTGKHSARRMRIVRSLPAALGADEITLHYQPLLDLASSEIRAYEALLRWFDPQLGAVSPAEFVPIAESAGLMNSLGHWVIRNAGAHAKTGPADGPRVAVNLSAVQIQSADIVEQVRAVLDESGLPAARLELEITESAIMQDRQAAERTLRALKALGVRISIDDFGTGYSSLSYLKDFPCDVVKIDRHFLTDVPHDARACELYRSIVDMARRLDLYVVAEGVETEAQRDFVRDAGCHAIQGFLISPALAPALVWNFHADWPASGAARDYRASGAAAGLAR
jgi:diguanylate cyclase (GGDEF)-like protein/PAS domain S-box-containing protein